MGKPFHQESKRFFQEGWQLKKSERIWQFIDKVFTWRQIVEIQWNYNFRSVGGGQVDILDVNLPQHASFEKNKLIGNGLKTFPSSLTLTLNIEGRTFRKTNISLTSIVWHILAKNQLTMSIGAVWAVTDKIIDYSASLHRTNPHHPCHHVSPLLQAASQTAVSSERTSPSSG